MALIATIVFTCSLIGILALFALKAWEVRRGYAWAPALRARADHQALRLKAYIMNERYEAAKIIPLLGLMGRYFMHEAALSFARAAHFAGVQAHRFADFVSHKHHFERQAPRSEFLKQVSKITERPTLSVNTAGAPVVAATTELTQDTPSPIAAEEMTLTTATEAPKPKRRSPRKRLKAL
ncbi:hypothetical protein HZC00_03200 [Candidatus Kaiserbacteria bacterium]|nr:hypothetical protein [Candidatus Kaiserbacteria bacterium]